MEKLIALKKHLKTQIVLLLASTVVVSLLIGNFFDVSLWGVIPITLVILIAGFSYTGVLKRRKLIKELTNGLESSSFGNASPIVGRGFTNQYFQKVKFIVLDDFILLSFNFAREKEPYKVMMKEVENLVLDDETYLSFNIIGCDIVISLPIYGSDRDDLFRRLKTHAS